MAKQINYCKEPGCENRCHGQGYCSTDYARFIRNGDLNLRRRKMGTGSITRLGYLAMGGNRKHILAGKTGKVFQHRIVLFDQIGMGPHLCYHCRKNGIITHINWNAPKPFTLETDHLDFDKLNNDSDNLVQSCKPCNEKRRKPKEIAL